MTEQDLLAIYQELSAPAVQDPDVIEGPIVPRLSLEERLDALALRLADPVPVDSIDGQHVETPIEEVTLEPVQTSRSDEFGETLSSLQKAVEAAESVASSSNSLTVPLGIATYDEWVALAQTAVSCSH